MNLSNKVALVTGSSRGIGAAIARELASKNCQVVINYLNSEEEAKALQQEIMTKYYVKTLLVKADVSNESDVKGMIDTIISVMGKLDIVVNNAGIAMDNDWQDKTVQEFKRVIDVNLLGTFLVSKYAGQYMLENKSGKIINISSTNGIDTNYEMSMDYDASKAGVISLTRNFAKALAPHINVNCIASGWVNTDPVINMEETYKQEEINKILLKRFADPSEIAKVAVFLASDDASYINGTVIRVDGGY